MRANEASDGPRMKVARKPIQFRAFEAAGALATAQSASFREAAASITFEAKHLKFVPGPQKPKTLTWWVVNKHDDIQLGWVAWFGRWRRYAFYPKPETVYEQDCLRDIANFCEQRTKEHKATGEI